jgi:hypothetical protein
MIFYKRKIIKMLLGELRRRDETIRMLLDRLMATDFRTFKEYELAEQQVKQQGTGREEEPYSEDALIGEIVDEAK